MMVAEYEEENSKSGIGDAPQDRYEREPVRRTPVEKIGEGEGLDKGSWSAAMKIQREWTGYRREAGSSEHHDQLR